MLHFNFGQYSKFRIFSILKIEHVLVCELYLNKALKKIGHVHSQVAHSYLPGVLTMTHYLGLISPNTVQFWQWSPNAALSSAALELGATRLSFCRPTGGPLATCHIKMPWKGAELEVRLKDPGIT